MTVKEAIEYLTKIPNNGYRRKALLETKEKVIVRDAGPWGVVVVARLADGQQISLSKNTLPDSQPELFL